jgi:phytoene dehydrogenase-like protein
MKVIIIGAGIAGLAAATELLKYGADVLILESNNRIGGRICKSSDLSTPVDLGASWIHRINGKPSFIFIFFIFASLNHSAVANYF